MSKASDVIAQKIYQDRILKRKQAKSLRAELAKLPYPVRASHIKMQDLKHDSKKLNRDREEVLLGRGGIWYC